MKDLIKAKSLLKDNTCVLVKEENIIISQKTGIKPLMEFVNQNKNLENYSLADKIIGKAVAMLCVHLKIKKVYARVISKLALDFLLKNNIYVEYENLVDNIINRKGDGFCPMEETVKEEDDINNAIIKLNNKIKSLISENK